MGHPLRRSPPGSLVEITCRTAASRLLLRPSSLLNLLLIGVVAMAKRLCDCEICFVVFVSNHVHLLVQPKDEDALAKFMCFLNSNVAREVNRLLGSSGPFWQRRYRAVLQSGEEQAQIDYLVYLLSHGAKEGLVWSPLDWPGVHSAWALMHGRPLRGIWIDRTAMYEARRRGEKVRQKDFTKQVEVELAPIPCWAHLESREYKRRITELVRRIEEETRVRHREAGTKPMGEKKILEQDPFSLPHSTKKSPAPMFRAATAEVWVAMRIEYRTFVAAFRQAAELLRQGVLDPPFPPGSFPPHRAFVPHPTPRF